MFSVALGIPIWFAWPLAIPRILNILWVYNYYYIYIYCKYIYIYIYGMSTSDQHGSLLFNPHIFTIYNFFPTFWPWMRLPALQQHQLAAAHKLPLCVRGTGCGRGRWVGGSEALAQADQAIGQSSGRSVGKLDRPWIGESLLRYCIYIYIYKNINMACALMIYTTHAPRKFMP